MISGKTFRGWRDERGEFRVVVHHDGKEEQLSPRFDLFNHSPTGFAWGYHGSGPAQLALAILADVLGAPLARPRRDDWQDDERDARLRAVRMHQFYKRAVIAGLPAHGAWEIDERDVLEWVSEHESGRSLRHG